MAKSHNHRAPSCGQVHRYCDLVAAYLPGGETGYFSVKEARAYARALNRAARSVASEAFVDSECTTTIKFARTDIHRDL